MTNATHTPGAWATDGREAAWDILDGDNKRIASVWRNIGKPQDARLIAAAPDLLAALEAVIPDLRDGIQDAIDNGANEAWLADADARLRNARDTIAKAKGA